MMFPDRLIRRPIILGLKDAQAAQDIRRDAGVVGLSALSTAVILLTTNAVSRRWGSTAPSILGKAAAGFLAIDMTRRTLNVAQSAVLFARDSRDSTERIASAFDPRTLVVPLQ